LYTFATGAAATVTNSLPAPDVNYTTVPSNYAPFDTYTYSDNQLPSGTYLPLEPFDNLVGCPLNGAWTIQVTDEVAKDNGWIMGWGIDFSDELFAQSEAFTPAFTDWGWENCPTVTTADQNCLVATPPNAGAGEYTFWTENEFGCRFDTTLLVEILPETHPACLTCEIDLNEIPDFSICPGDSIMLDGRVNNTSSFPVVFERFPKYELGAANHPTDAQAYRSTLQINNIKPLTLDNFTTQIEAVCIDFTTDDLSDLEFRLEAPNGVVIPLVNRGTLAGMNMVSTCFVPIAAPISGAEPYTGTFAPDGDQWADFSGTDINGSWTLLVTDNAGTNFFGELQHWSISFNTANEFNYVWSPTADFDADEINSPTATITPSQAGDYILTVTDCYGCSVQDTVSVSFNQDLPTPQVSCTEEGSTLRFSWEEIAGFTDYEYRIITDGVPGPWIATTDLTVAIENLNNGDQRTVEVRLVLTSGGCAAPVGSTTCTSTFCGLNLTADVQDWTCYDSNDGSLTITISSGNAPYDLLVVNTNGDQRAATGSGPTLLIEDLAPDNYTYTLTADDACFVSNAFTISAPDTILVSLTQDNVSCFGENEGSVVAAASGGTGALGFAWSNPTLSGLTASNLAPGPLSFTATDAANCTATASIEVVEADSVSFNFIIASPTCAGGSDGNLGVNNFSGGQANSSADYQIEWFNGSDSLTVIGVPAGTYSVTITDTAGCSSTQTRTLPDSEGIQIEIEQQDPSCSLGSDGTITVTSAEGPNGTVTDFTWSPIGATGNVVTDLPAGTYVLTATDSEGCAQDSTITLNDPPPLNFSAATTDVECFGGVSGAVSLTATGGVPDYTFTWPDLITTDNRQNLTAGTYAITLEDANGCQLTQSVMLDQPAAITAVATPQGVDCFGDENGRLSVVVSGGSAPFRYSLDGINFSTSSQFLGLDAGDYTLFIEDNEGCVFQTNTTISEPPALILNTEDELTLTFGENRQLGVGVINAQGDWDVFWSEPYPGTLSCLDCPNPFAQPEFTIDYRVLVVDDMGCEAEASIRLNVLKPKLVLVPTGFTPGDGTGPNDVLVVHGRVGTTVEHFQVYDRWGELLYDNPTPHEVNTLNVGWDGSFRGEPMSPGVYVWVVTVTHEDGTLETLRGQTTLIR
ncbi:MAG: proprotein convertase P-domain-containing protein, partial [Bacteroidota bacterium]